MSYSALLIPDRWYLWLLIIGGGGALLVAWYTKNFAYQHPKSGEVFEISPLGNIFSPNI
ncbi:MULTISPECIES: hypothetical protein [unclassified Methanosarcina]|uniref:hypothetical protein n=1 Tax=unclassified Methanosarcina TaxID=2644672 RepID=UPI000AFAC6FF|nr:MULTISPECIES: hypothetical protein [unclassified Methanosarcina]